MPAFKSEAGQEIRKLLEWQEAAAEVDNSLKGRLGEAGKFAGVKLIPFVEEIQAAGVDTKGIMESWKSFWKEVNAAVESCGCVDTDTPKEIADEGEAEALRAAWFAGMSGGNIEGEIASGEKQ